MKFVIQMNEARDLENIINSEVQEVILASSELARFGELSLNEVQDIARRLTDCGKRPVLCFDILMTENVFAQKMSLLNTLDLSVFSAIRVQDPGALSYLLEHPSSPMIQLIVETGNHNTRAILEWAEIAGEKLDRLILSLEWPRTELFKLLSETGLPFEIMGLGPILLFYSPRSLVRPLVNDEWASSGQLSLNANSEESPHKGFRVLENSHGTFMFHPKHHGLLEEVLELKTAGLSAFRLELVGSDDRELIANFAQLLKARDEESVLRVSAAIKERYDHTLIKGFYKANKSNVLFKKLKNDRLSARSDSLVGPVLDYQKGRPLAVRNLHPTRSVCLGESFSFLSTEGKKKELKLERLLNISGQEITELAPGAIGLFPFVGSMSVKSQVFWQN